MKETVRSTAMRISIEEEIVQYIEGVVASILAVPLGGQGGPIKNLYRLHNESLLPELEFWPWHGKPRVGVVKNDELGRLYAGVNNLIRQGGPECLMSPIKYIRECKRYYLEEEKWNKK